MPRHSKNKPSEPIWQRVRSLSVSLDEDQWASLCKLRSIRPQKLGFARQSLNAAINRFILRKAADLTPATLRKKMDAFGFGMKKLHPVFSELRDLNDVKQSLGSESPFGVGTAALELDNSLYEDFAKATHNLLMAMENCIDELPKTNRGPKNSAVVQLIKDLDDIASTCSDGGHLDRSYKAYDIKFALAVFRIAEENFKRKTNAGSVENAIKKLVRERINRSPTDN